MDTTRELLAQWMKDGSRLLAQLLNDYARVTAALGEARRECGKLKEDFAALREENDRVKKERREALDTIAAALGTASAALSRFPDAPAVMTVTPVTEAVEPVAPLPPVAPAEAGIDPPALAPTPTPAPTPSPPEKEPGALRPQHILVVDDEQTFRDMLAWHLRGRYEVATADSGEEALRLLENARPEVVLLDLRMPGMGGMEALRCIKALYPNLCVVMVTASDDREGAQEALALGAADYLKKPFDLNYLDAALEIYMTVSDALPGTVFSAVATAAQGAPCSPIKSPFTRP